MNTVTAEQLQYTRDLEQRVSGLLQQMTLAEKIGQMNQLDASHGAPVEYLAQDLRAGRIGAVLNVTDVTVVNELQRIAVDESRLGIPLLVGRDVIHGIRPFHLAIVNVNCLDLITHGIIG